MITALALPCAGLGVLLALLAGTATARGRRIDDLQLAAAALVELGALAQAAVGIAQLVRLDSAGARSVSPVVFGGYLLAALLVPPLGVFWALGERSRWGTGVLTVAGLVSAVLVARLEQVWHTGG